MPVARNGHTIILGEDDLEVRNYLETALICQGYAVETAQNGEEVLACFQDRQTPVTAVVLDVIMPRTDGIEALKEIRRLDPELPVIMMSGASSPLNIVEAMKNGANDFIVKPLDPDVLRKALQSAIETRSYAPANPAPQAAQPANDKLFLSTSPKMRKLQSLVNAVGWSEAPVLIHGETGVGKEVFVRQLHACSPRSKKAVFKLNCAALPSELVESELFGYERGAFTGAFQRKPGMFELADGGTILLDEIGDMDFKLQAKLLQVLQDHEFQRIGGKETIKVDVRVIAATHCDLEKAIAEGRFREDLYYRLNVIAISIPPLRERGEDILPMAEFFVGKYLAPGTKTVRIPPALQELFLEYRWPGNVRELENVVRKLLVYRDAKLVEQDLRDKMARIFANGGGQVKTVPAPERPPVEEPVPQPQPISVPAGKGTDVHFNVVLEGRAPVLEQVANAKREAERSAILAALKATNWNRRQASVQMRIDYKALLYKMKVLAIKKEKKSAASAGARQ